MFNLAWKPEGSDGTRCIGVEEYSVKVNFCK